MTPLRWKVAGAALLVVAGLLVIAALVSVLTAPPFTDPIYADRITSVVPVSDAGVLRGVVLGAFAGVAFFLGLACFLASAVAEASRQREDILVELTALRSRAERAAGPEEG